MDSKFTVYVARLITEDELILNVGSGDNVAVGDRFAIVDTLAVDVPDPITGENLGSVPRYKAVVEVTQVAEKLSLAKKVVKSSFSLAEVVSGSSLSRTLAAGDIWPEGVAVADPALKIRRKG